MQIRAQKVILCHKGGTLGSRFLHECLRSGRAVYDPRQGLKISSSKHKIVKKKKKKKSAVLAPNGFTVSQSPLLTSLCCLRSWCCNPPHFPYHSSRGPALSGIPGEHKNIRRHHKHNQGSPTPGPSFCCCFPVSVGWTCLYGNSTGPPATRPLVHVLIRAIARAVSFVWFSTLTPPTLM